MTGALALAATERGLLVCGAVSGVLAILWGAARHLGHGVRARDLRKRGAMIETEGQARRRCARHAGGAGELQLALAGVSIRPADETKHFKLVGTTGTGKSTAIRQLLAGALERGDRAILADPEGGSLARFYDRFRGDVILNPFEERSAKWDPFGEVCSAYDVDQLAAGLIPASADAAAQEWRGYARTFLAAVLWRCLQQRQVDLAELWRLLAVASARELRRLVAGTAAQPFLEPANARMFGSIRSVMVASISALRHVQEQRGPGFSVRDWVRRGSGVLFMPYHAGQIAALRSIIATWMRLAIFEAMSRGERDQRLWFVIDELDALGAIDGLKDALARLRKFGGRCVLGFQSISQVSGTYGPGEAQTIVENCGNTLILRCSGSEQGGTASFASRLIGEREVVRRQTVRGRDRDGLLAGRGLRRSTNISEQHVMEAAVLPSEIEQLADLRGFLKTASSPVWLRVAV